MAPKENIDLGLSQAELRLLVAVMKRDHAVPDVDWEAVAQDYGYKNGALARKKFAALKSRIKKTADESPAGKSGEASKTGEDVSKTPTKLAGPATESASKRKKRNANEMIKKESLADDEEDADDIKKHVTPKRAKRTPKKVNKQELLDEDEEDEDEEDEDEEDEDEEDEDEKIHAAMVAHTEFYDDQ
ncbi:MAG: hypothetical protein MMC23_008018 [Stictis urceolatum]|nr:hypothetical protein [Stictis urceolata]